VIIQNCKRFTIWEEDQEKMFIPLPLLTKVFGVLVNPSVTELNCIAFVRDSEQCFNNFLLEHALENCPQIRKISLENNDKLFEKKHNNNLPVELFIKSWRNLTYIKAHTFICNEKALKLIQKSFPNIE